MAIVYPIKWARWRSTSEGCNDVLFNNAASEVPDGSSRVQKQCKDTKKCLLIFPSGRWWLKELFCRADQSLITGKTFILFLAYLLLVFTFCPPAIHISPLRCDLLNESFKMRLGRITEHSHLCRDIPMTSENFIRASHLKVIQKCKPKKLMTWVEVPFKCITQATGSQNYSIRFS